MLSNNKLVSALEDSSRSAREIQNTSSNRGKTRFSTKNIFSEKCSFSKRLPFQTPLPMFNLISALKIDAKSPFSFFFGHLGDHEKSRKSSKIRKIHFLYFNIFSKILYKKHSFSFRLWNLMLKTKINTHFSVKIVAKHFFNEVKQCEIKSIEPPCTYRKVDFTLFKKNILFCNIIILICKIRFCFEKHCPKFRKFSKSDPGRNPHAFLDQKSDFSIKPRLESAAVKSALYSVEKIIVLLGKRIQMCSKNEIPLKNDGLMSNQMYMQLPVANASKSSRMM